jgi:hypothetical protein
VVEVASELEQVLLAVLVVEDLHQPLNKLL